MKKTITLEYDWKCQILLSRYECNPQFNINNLLHSFFNTKPSQLLIKDVGYIYKNVGHASMAYKSVCLGLLAGGINNDNDIVKRKLKLLTDIRIKMVDDIGRTIQFINKYIKSLQSTTPATKDAVINQKIRNLFKRTRALIGSNYNWSDLTEEDVFVCLKSDSPLWIEYVINKWLSHNSDNGKKSVNSNNRQKKLKSKKPKKSLITEIKDARGGNIWSYYAITNGMVMMRCIGKTFNIVPDSIVQNMVDYDGNSPLHLAAAHGSDRVMHYLLSQITKKDDKIIAINRVNNEQWNCWALCIIHDHPECLSPILDLMVLGKCQSFNPIELAIYGMPYLCLRRHCVVV